MSELVTLPKGWIELEFSKTIKIIPLTGKKLKQKEYLQNGDFPVIDQGLDFIGGFTNDSQLLVRCLLPVIIFGDHTKIVKFVNQDFVAGADGVKVLQPNSFFIPKLLFYFIQSISLPNKGYARHYQYLNKSKMRVPPLNEQKRIVSKIDKLFLELDKVINVLEKVKLQLLQYNQSLLKSTFEGKLMEKNKIKKLGDIEISEIIMGQSPPSSTYNYEKKGIPFFQGKKDFGKKYPTPTVWCTKPKRIAKKGDILISIRAPVGATNWANEECCIGRGLSAIRVKILPEYVYYFLKSVEIKLSMTGGGTVFNSMTKNQLYDLSIYSPSLEKQKEIIIQLEKEFLIIENIEKVINTMLKQVKILRSSILKKAFEGKLVPQDPNDKPEEKLLQRIKEQQTKIKSRDKK